MGGECALLELPSWHSQLCSKPTDIYQLYDRKIESNKERKNYIKIDFGIDWMKKLIQWVLNDIY